MKIAILGSGTWGTALASVLADNGHDICIYGREESQVNDINLNHKNSQYFGDEIILNNKISATLFLEESLKDANIILLSVPTSAMRSLLVEVKNIIKDQKKIFINTAKGFDTLKNQRISELIEEVVGDNISSVVSLIGPSHAEEVIVKDLTCIAAVSSSFEDAKLVAGLFSNNYFRVYIQTEVVGAEIGVAMKNAIALASGMLEGLGYGDNARAALCSRGLAEIVKFGTICGGNFKTYLGLTGLGDLVVTCYSFHSRNFKAGLAIGKDDSAISFLEKNQATVEGIRTVKVISEMAKEKGIELPIIDALYKILYLGATPSKEVKELMNRPLKSE